MVSTIDPALVKICDEIAARGGPPRLPGVPTGVLFPAAAAPVVRASARLRGVQPEVDASKSSEGNARRTRRSSDPGTMCVGDMMSRLWVVGIGAVLWKWVAEVGGRSGWKYSPAESGSLATSVFLVGRG